MLIPETLKKYRFKCKGNPIKTFMNTKTKQANMKQTFQTYKPSASGVKMNPSKGRTTSASTLIITCLSAIMSVFCMGRYRVQLYSIARAV